MVPTSQVEANREQLVNCNYRLPRWIAEGIKKRSDANGMKIYRYVAVVLGAHLAKEAKKQ